MSSKIYVYIFPKVPILSKVFSSHFELYQRNLKPIYISVKLSFFRLHQLIAFMYWLFAQISVFFLHSHLDLLAKSSRRSTMCVDVKFFYIRTEHFFFISKNKKRLNALNCLPNDNKFKVFYDSICAVIRFKYTHTHI